mgnify:CR=1 FL=1
MVLYFEVVCWGEIKCIVTKNIFPLQNAYGPGVRVLSAWLGMDITLRYGATDQRTAEQEFDNPTV